MPSFACKINLKDYCKYATCLVLHVKYGYKAFVILSSFACKIKLEGICNLA